LGWDVRDPDEVQLEYPTIDGKSVDYALKTNQKPVLLVEAKPLNDSLTDVKDVTQTTGYAANNGIVWCILTNGVRWQVYCSVEQCPAPEKLMFEVSYDPVSLEGISLEQVAEQFHRFSRDEMPKGTLEKLREQTFTDGKVRKALHKLITEPPKVLLKLVRNATEDNSLRPQTVKESLGRVLLPLLGPVSGELKQSRKKRGVETSSVTRSRERNMRYTEAVHTQGKPREVIEFYQRLDQFCLGLRPGAIEKNFMAKYISYREGKRIFCSVHLLQGGLRIWLKTKYHRLTNPPEFVRDVSAIGHWGVGDVELAITNLQQLTAAELLIRQCFEEG
jgi:predicted transport protein